MNDGPRDDAPDEPGEGPPDGPPDGPPNGPPGARSASAKLLEALVCPATGARLEYDAERGELVSRSAMLAYPIRSGIPIMLIHEARKLED